jgi:hypothetical protein
MPNDKVLKSFQSTFNSPREVKWFEHKNFYEVSFVQADTRVKVRYDLEGNFVTSTRYYKESELPANIVLKLKKNFAGKEIFGVTEVSDTEEINYFVKLHDNKHWYTVKVNGNGQTELVEKYRKA